MEPMSSGREQPGSMSAPTLTPLLSQAVQDRTSGATGVARQVLAGLLELTSDRELLHSIADVLPGKFPGYASMWHISRAARSADPRSALRAIHRQLDVDVDRSVATAARLVRERGGSVRTAPSSALVKAVVAALPKATDGTRVTGLAGADAISPTTVLNIRGTLELAKTLPTIVVTTSLKLVPERSSRSSARRCSSASRCTFSCRGARRRGPHARRGRRPSRPHWTYRGVGLGRRRLCE